MKLDDKQECMGEIYSVQYPPQSFGLCLYQHKAAPLFSTLIQPMFIMMCVCVRVRECMCVSVSVSVCVYVCVSVCSRVWPRCVFMLQLMESEHIHSSVFGLVEDGYQSPTNQKYSHASWTSQPKIINLDLLWDRIQRHSPQKTITAT